MRRAKVWEVIVVGGGMAGLSAAIYLGRAMRSTLVVDSGKSMAKWEPHVHNYLGFPEGIAGKELLRRGRAQALRYGSKFVEDEIRSVRRRKDRFVLRGARKFYQARAVLLATGIFHIPPNIPGIEACLGHSMFFCKDCDGYRVRKKHIAIYGANNDAVEYALGMLAYSQRVAIITDGRNPGWSAKHKRWVKHNHIPVYRQHVLKAVCRKCQIQALQFADGSSLNVDAMFTTRGDIYLNKLADELGAELKDGEIQVDACMRTTTKKVYAAGCVTPANCQMIIAAGQGAAAAQAINRDLFEEALAQHTLRRKRLIHVIEKKTALRHIQPARPQSKTRPPPKKPLRKLLPARVRRATTSLRAR